MFNFKNFNNMKNLIKTIVVLFALSAILTACKKDAVDLKNSYMNIIVSENGLWAFDNDIRYVANLKPGTLTGDKVTITYTSEADPQGISIESSYLNTELTSGRDVYNIQKIDRSFYVAVETNADKGRLKVNPDGDNVTITIGDNAFSETVKFEKKYNPLVVANTPISGVGCLYGDIHYYNETEERPEIKIYSKTSSSPIKVMPNADLGENGYRAANVETGDDFSYTTYKMTLVYDREKYQGTGSNEIDINLDSDIIYVEIEGVKFSVPIEGEKIYQTIMSPSK